jgi:hypothetical protein
MTKRSIAVGLAWWSVMAVCAGNLHTFTDMQGREIEAEIVAFDEWSGKVRLEREDGRTFEVQSTLFSETDREYMQAWAAAGTIPAGQAFTSKGIFRMITFKRRSGNEKRFSGTLGLWLDGIGAGREFP